MDKQVESLYRHVYEDRVVDPDENAELVETLRNLTRIQSTTPPLTPDKAWWLRAAAFRIAGEFLCDDREETSCSRPPTPWSTRSRLLFCFPIFQTMGVMSSVRRNSRV